MLDMKLWWVGFVIAGVALPFAMLGVPVGGALVIGLLGGGALSIFIIYKKETAKSNYVSYGNKTLYLKQRGFPAGKSIVIKRFYKEGATYKPAEIVYSGMTIGGVSVGSAHINEAHYESHGIKTEKFLMYYEDETKPIERIECTFNISKDSAISKYAINKNTILVKEPSAKDNLDGIEKQMLYDNMASGNKAMEAHIIGQHLEQKLLSKKDCQTIKSWIGGEIN
ncbi:MAG: hypothetical protein IJN56_00095 [Clostridia bacterium]|nr:hypothetical protein [Clostridia bacterium]